MKLNDACTLRRMGDGERGQTLVMVPALLGFLLAASALVIDMGNLYFSYQELLSATQAAAAAGGKAMTNGAVTSVITVVDQYSGQSSSDYNYHPNLNITSVTSNYACVSATTYPNLKLPPCAAYFKLLSLHRHDQQSGGRMQCDPGDGAGNSEDLLRQGVRRQLHPHLGNRQRQRQRRRGHSLSHHDGP